MTSENRLIPKIAMSCPSREAALAVALPNIGGWITGYINKNEVKNWYQTINKAELSPPDWVFGPVWTSLYSGMGYASYLVWRDTGGFNGVGRLPLTLYAAQLGLNLAWSPIFFQLKSFKWAFAEGLLLLGTAGATAISFYKVNHTAGLIMLPYIAWLSFASHLTYCCYKLNPPKDKD